MLSLLLQHSLAMANAFVTVLVRLDPLTLENLDSEASVHRVIAGKMAIRESPADLMTALIGYAFKVAHGKSGL